MTLPTRRSFLKLSLLGVLPALPSTARYVALGDSFSAGTAVGAELAFPVRLAARLERAGVALALRNLAVNGYTARDVLTLEIPALSASGAELVTLAAGANDIVHGSSEAEYRAVLRQLFAALKKVPLVVTLPQPDWSQAPAAALFDDPAAIVARIQTFNRALREETGSAARLHVDLWPLMQRQARAGAWANDHLHPSAAALEEWAAELARQLRPRLR